MRTSLDHRVVKVRRMFWLCLRSTIPWINLLYLLEYYYAFIIVSLFIIASLSNRYCNFVTASIGRCEHMEKWIANLLPRWMLNSLDSRELGIAFTITAGMKKLVENQMRSDDETMAYELHKLLMSKGYSISFLTVLRCCTSLVRTFRGSAYWQLICPLNKLNCVMCVPYKW